MRTIELPDGAVITGRGLRQGKIVDPHPEYGVYLQHRPVDVPWPHDWIDWPDFRLPRDHDAAIGVIRALHARALSGERVEVACSGGVGRTGTVISCLAVLSGVPADEAVAWTRAHYHPRAVETPWQKRWVRRFPPS
ncbi:protein-tyrosine phosphatase family protein [Lentzea flava]|uniref:Protein-tyrosine-phosphatase n=1 Tax=Lentzea flava TaxID=103732 RepID=A0ABQ2UL46_9PSEU|nr:Protein-tyrosine phosphatase [Lentzea flava]GGU38645.1 protein-tyrosine-phosphatase [Lentzea flava]